MLTEHSIIGSYMNEEKTEAYHLTAGGDLVRIHRPDVSAVWSPPQTVASVQPGPLADLLGGVLTGQRML